MTSTSPKTRRVPIALTFAATALITCAITLLAQWDRDTVPGCAKAIGTEWARNMADPEREVQDNVDHIPQCDHLTPAQQDQASTAVVDEVFGGWSP